MKKSKTNLSVAWGQSDECESNKDQRVDLSALCPLCIILSENLRKSNATLILDNSLCTYFCTKTWKFCYQYLLSFLGGVGGWRKQRDDRALPRSEAPFTNFSVYSRTSQLGQFLTILCLKIAFLHLKFYTTESSLLLKVLFNGQKWIVEA